MKLLTFLIITGFIFFSTESFSQDDDKIIIGKIEKIKSEVLGEERTIFVHLPNGYELTNTKYPVLFLLDGNSHFIHTTGTTSFLAGGNNVIPQMIVVGIPNTQRGRDFTPTATENVPNSGGADNFISFLKNELLPYIDNNYRTEPYRILFGHSLTAMFSIYTLIKEPQLFDAYIAASPYVMYDNNYAVNLAEKSFSSKNFNKHKNLYITLGNEPDYMEQLSRLMDILRENESERFEWSYTLLDKDNHGTVPLKTIYSSLEDLYKDWSLPDGFASEGTIEKLVNHYENLSERFGYEINVPEFVANIVGYQVLFNNRPKDAIEIFRYNVKMYPESPNVYDSLGEGLEADGQLEEAKKHYKKAYEMGQKINDPNLPFYKEHLEKIDEKISMK